jgi:hypothetical protein
MITRSEYCARAILQRLHDHLTFGDCRSAHLAEKNGLLAGQELRRALYDFAATGARHGERHRQSSIGGNLPEAGVTCRCEDNAVR